MKSFIYKIMMTGLATSLLTSLSWAQSTSPRESAVYSTLTHYLEKAERVTNPIQAKDIDALSRSMNQVHYLPITWIRPGQVRAAIIVKSLQKAVKMAAKHPNVKNGSIELSESALLQRQINPSQILRKDEGRSLIPKKKTSTAVITREGQIMLVDGHHKMLANILAGGQTMPVLITKDLRKAPAEFSGTQQEWRDLSEKEMNKWLNTNGYMHLEYADGTQAERPPERFDGIINDSNRALPDLYTMKVELNYKNGQQVYTAKSSSPESPIVIKVGGGVNFSEFGQGDFLREHGIVYQSEWNGELPTDVHRKIQALFWKAQANQNPVISRLLVVPPHTSVTNKNVADFIVENGTSCSDMVEAAE